MAQALADIVMADVRDSVFSDPVWTESQYRDVCARVANQSQPECQMINQIINSECEDPAVDPITQEPISDLPADRIVHWYRKRNEYFKNTSGTPRVKVCADGVAIARSVLAGKSRDPFIPQSRLTDDQLSDINRFMDEARSQQETERKDVKEYEEKKSEQMIIEYAEGSMLELERAQARWMTELYQGWLRVPQIENYQTRQRAYQKLYNIYHERDPTLPFKRDELQRLERKEWRDIQMDQMLTAEEKTKRTQALFATYAVRKKELDPSDVRKPIPKSYLWNFLNNKLQYAPSPFSTLNKAILYELSQVHRWKLNSYYVRQVYTGFMFGCIPRPTANENGYSAEQILDFFMFLYGTNSTTPSSYGWGADDLRAHRHVDQWTSPLFIRWMTQDMKISKDYFKTIPMMMLIVESIYRRQIVLNLLQSNIFVRQDLIDIHKIGEISTNFISQVLLREFLSNTRQFFTEINVQPVDVAAGGYTMITNMLHPSADPQQLSKIFYIWQLGDITSRINTTISIDVHDASKTITVRQKIISFVTSIAVNYQTMFIKFSAEIQRLQRLEQDVKTEYNQHPTQDNLELLQSTIKEKNEFLHEYSEVEKNAIILLEFIQSELTKAGQGFILDEFNDPNVRNTLINFLITKSDGNWIYNLALLNTVLDIGRPSMTLLQDLAAVVKDKVPEVYDILIPHIQTIQAKNIPKDRANEQKEHTPMEK